MLALDVIFGSPLVPDLLGIIAGHLYYFLTVLHPLATGKNLLKTPKWVYPYFYWFLRVKNYAAPSNPPEHSAGCVKPNIIRDIFSLSTQAHAHTHAHARTQDTCSHWLVCFLLFFSTALGNHSVKSGLVHHWHLLSSNHEDERVNPVVF